MTHVLATASLHDGGGIFSLVWSLVAVPLGLAVVFNYRGMAERVRWGRGFHRGPPVSPRVARLFGGFFVAFGILFLSEAIVRFAHGGY